MNNKQAIVGITLGFAVMILISGYLVGINSMPSVCNSWRNQGQLRSFSTSLVSGWRREWHYDTDTDNCWGIAAVNDKVYIAGNVINGATNGSIFLARYDSLGQIEINKTWFDPNYYASYCYALALSSNAAFVGGSEWHTGGLKESLLVAKFDLNGNEVWNYSYDYSSHDQDQVQAITTSGNDVYACGSLYTSGGDYDAFLMRLHGNNGTRAWDATWSGGGFQMFVDLVVSGNIVYVLGDDGGTTMQIWRYYTNGTYIGTFTWHTTLYSELSCNGLAILNGNYYLAGSARNITDHQVLLVKLDSAGNEIWNRTWGGSKTENTYRVVANGSSVFVVARSNSYTPYDAGILLQFDESGTLLANWTIGGDKETTMPVIAVCGSSIYTGGYFWPSVGPPYDHVFLMRFVMNAPPALSHPADIQYMQGSSGHVIAWNITDLSINETYYEVTRNGTGIKNGTWVSGDGISVAIDGLDVGNYNFTIVVQDGLSTPVTDQVMVTVIPVTPQNNSTVGLVIILCVIGGLVVVGVFVVRSLVKSGVISFKKKRE